FGPSAPETAGRWPFAAAGRAGTGRGGAAAGPRLEEMPDERLVAVTRVLALDRDAEAAAPTGHRPLGAGRRQRLDDRLDNLLPAMIAPQRDPRLGPCPHDRSSHAADGDRAERAGV